VHQSGTVKPEEWPMVVLPRVRLGLTCHRERILGATLAVLQEGVNWIWSPPGVAYSLLSWYLCSTAWSLPS